ncbi:MFS transporter [Streptomyces sp. NPDC091272]|uniref:MFS transporter n=1 Tax=Streptomyces sp. NPDC091272 TaxID=3365981 RepID=UPI0038023FB1
MRGIWGSSGSRSLGRRFGWLWAAYAVSAYGTSLGFGAFPMIAILVLHSGPTQVAALAATGRAVGALVAVPLGPWVEFRRKRPVMVGMDLVRFAALLSVPGAFALGVLSFAQLLVVSVVTAAANIAFNAASGAYVKGLVPREDLVVANGRFESTMWTATTVGPPLGGMMIGIFGPVTTVLVDAVSYLLSALGIRAIGGTEQAPERPGGPVPEQRDGPVRGRPGESHAAQPGDPHPPRSGGPVPPRSGGPVPQRPDGPAPLRPGRRPRLRAGDLLAGWRHILTHPTLRPLFLNALVVNGLIMATEPVLAVLLLGRLGFTPWQYGLVFALPCVGGLVGARLAGRFVVRFGRHRVLLTAGVLRVIWPVGLAFVTPGVPGMVLIVVVQFGLVTCCALYSPVLATYRLDHTGPDRVARTLAAWSVSSSIAIAAMTALWGLLAAVVGPRTAIGAAGALLLATPLLLPRREGAPAQTAEAPAGQAAGPLRP